MLSSPTLVNCFFIKKVDFNSIACLLNKLILFRTKIVNLATKIVDVNLLEFSCFEIVKLLIKLIVEIKDENTAHFRLALRPALYDEKS